MKADKAGVGLFKVWKLQLQQLHNLGPDMAAAITAVFPSPLALQKVGEIVLGCGCCVCAVVIVLYKLCATQPPLLISESPGAVCVCFFIMHYPPPLQLLLFSLMDDTEYNGICYEEQRLWAPKKPYR